MDSNKRVILAVSLSLMVLLGWNYFFPPVTPLETATQNVTSPNQTAASAPEAGMQAATSVSNAPTVQFAPVKGERLAIETPLYHAVFHSACGVLESFVLKA